MDIYSGTQVPYYCTSELHTTDNNCTDVTEDEYFEIQRFLEEE